MDARIKHSQLHRDLHAGGNRMSLHPFHGFLKTHSASAFLMKAIAVLQHLQLLDQPRALHQEGMAGLIATFCMHELNRPPSLEIEQALDRDTIQDGNIEDAQLSQDLWNS